ncbi:MAG: aminotransferase class I/II-fold pyridoxal phosphate-dependent enzyme, partial [Aquificota bacterium]
VIYKHNDVNDLEDKLKKNIPERLSFIITDGVFSMEGDIAPLKDIVFLAKKYNSVVIIDDAHATGVLGEGKGTLFHYGLKPDENIIQVGTLSKAVGSYGAFICGSNTLIDFLTNKMRTGIFSTGLSPVQNFISLSNLRILIEDNYRRENLFEKVSYLYKKLKDSGVEINFYGTPILTYIVGDDKTAIEIRDKFLEHGIFIQAIRPPTVPEGTARLRITVSYKHEWKDIKKLIKIFKNLYSEVCHG